MDPSLCAVAGGIRCWVRDNGDLPVGWEQFCDDDGNAILVKPETLATNISAFAESSDGVLSAVKLAGMTLRGLRQGVRCVGVL